MTRRTPHAHRRDRVREAVDVVCFFVAVVLVVLVLSIDGVAK